MCQAPKIFLASDVDATVERVAAGSHAWAALGVEGRLRHLHTLRSKLSRADFAAWTAGSIHAQGLDPNSDLGRAQQVAEMMTLSAVAAGELGRIADTCKRLAAGRARIARPLLPRPSPVERVGARQAAVAHVLEEQVQAARRATLPNVRVLGGERRAVGPEHGG